MRHRSNKWKLANVNIVKDVSSKDNRYLSISRDKYRKKLFIEYVSNRPTETLLEAIQPWIPQLWIKPRTIVMSGFWKAFNYLENNTYQHLTVSPEYNFVGPEINVYTQNIERAWRDEMIDAMIRYKTKIRGCYYYIRSSQTLWPVLHLFWHTRISRYDNQKSCLFSPKLAWPSISLIQPVFIFHTRNKISYAPDCKRNNHYKL